MIFARVECEGHQQIYGDPVLLRQVKLPSKDLFVTVALSKQNVVCRAFVELEHDETVFNETALRQFLNVRQNIVDCDVTFHLPSVVDSLSDFKN